MSYLCIAINVPDGVSLESLDGAVVELTARPEAEESGYYAMEVRIPGPHKELSHA